MSGVHVRLVDRDRARALCREEQLRGLRGLALRAELDAIDASGRAAVLLPGDAKAACIVHAIFVDEQRGEPAQPARHDLGLAGLSGQVDAANRAIFLGGVRQGRRDPVDVAACEGEPLDVAALRELLLLRDDARAAAGSRRDDDVAAPRGEPRNVLVIDGERIGDLLARGDRHGGTARCRGRSETRARALRGLGGRGRCGELRRASLFGLAREGLVHAMGARRAIDGDACAKADTTPDDPEDRQDHDRAAFVDRLGLTVHRAGALWPPASNALKTK